MLSKQNSNKSFISTLAGSILLLAIVLFSSSCAPNKPEEIKELTNREELPSHTLKDLESIITDSGKIRYRFTTPELQQFDQRQEATIEFPEGLHLYVYNSLEEIEAQIKCKQAIFHQAKDLWELRNDVEAVSLDGEVINTELMYWDMSAKTLYSDEFIKITTETEIITGTGFESDERMENYKIKNISGILQVEEPAGRAPEKTTGS